MADMGRWRLGRSPPDLQQAEDIPLMAWRYASLLDVSSVGEPTSQRLERLVSVGFKHAGLNVDVVKDVGIPGNLATGQLLF